MLNGSELETAITAVLIGAVCLGFLLHWLWSWMGGGPKTAAARLDEMAEQLHDADLERETAEAARREAEARLAEREAASAERIAALQSRLDGAVDAREAELERTLAETKLELEVMTDGLANARRRIFDLEAEIEKLQGKAKKARSSSRRRPRNPN